MGEAIIKLRRNWPEFDIWLLQKSGSELLFFNNSGMFGGLQFINSVTLPTMYVFLRRSPLELWIMEQGAEFPEGKFILPGNFFFRHISLHQGHWACSWRMENRQPVREHQVPLWICLVVCWAPGTHPWTKVLRGRDYPYLWSLIALTHPADFYMCPSASLIFESRIKFNIGFAGSEVVLNHQFILFNYNLPPSILCPPFMLSVRQIKL